MTDKSYTSVSMRKGLKDDLNRLKNDGETYSDVIEDMLADRFALRDEYETRLGNMERLLVWMVRKQGMSEDDFSDVFVEYVNDDIPLYDLATTLDKVGYRSQTYSRDYRMGMEEVVRLLRERYDLPANP